VLSDNVNTSVAGSYTVEYSAKDIANNYANAIRIVNVVGAGDSSESTSGGTTEPIASSTETTTSTTTETNTNNDSSVIISVSGGSSINDEVVDNVIPDGVIAVVPGFATVTNIDEEVINPVEVISTNNTDSSSNTNFVATAFEGLSNLSNTVKGIVLGVLVVLLGYIGYFMYRKRKGLIVE
jgi:hypothetical protein